MLVGHIRNLRKIKEYQNAYIEVFIESNMSWISADAVAEEFLKIDNRINIVVGDRQKQRYGVHTGETEKQVYSEGLQPILMENRIHFADVIASEDFEKRKSELLDQLKCFRRIVRTSNDPEFGKNKFTYTGKSSGQKDDLGFVIQMTSYLMHKFRCDEHFRFKYNSMGISV